MEVVRAVFRDARFAEVAENSSWYVWQKIENKDMVFKKWVMALNGQSSSIGYFKHSS